MTKYFKQANLPVLLLSALFIKGLFFGAGAFVVISTFACTILFGYKLFLDHIKKPDFSQVVSDRFDKLEASFDSKIKELDTINKERTRKTEAKISTLTLGMGGDKDKSVTFGW